MAPTTPAPSTVANGVKGSGSTATNGTNGHSMPPMSPSGYKLSATRARSDYFGASIGAGKRISSVASSGMRPHHTSQKLSMVEDTAYALKRKSLSELGSGIYSSIDETTFIKLVEQIRQERLSSLPHQGSRWDTVLVRALYFADHLNGLQNAISGFASGSEAAAQLGYAHARLLLELGHENSAALDKAFGLLYKCTLSVSSLLERSSLLSVTTETKEELCLVYTDLLTLVVEVAARFYKAVNGMTTASVSVDLYDVFGGLLETFRLRRNKIVTLIWNHQIEGDGQEAEVPIETLDKWLGSQDRVMTMLGNDHTLFADEQAEFTCLWFHDDLTSFIKSNNECLLVNGPPGSGKTTLAAAIIERLQRPIARKTYSTLFCSIGSVASQATSLHLVKTLLLQLLSQRIGNTDFYRALIKAYAAAGQTADPGAYEELLWDALTVALQHTLEHANDTVLVVDGIDEVSGGAQAGQALLSKLTKTVGRARKTKIIALSQSLSLPTGARGSRRDIKPEDTHQDLHQVAIRALAHCSHFTSRPGPEQESILANLTETSAGSFLWLIYVCENLRLEKSPEGFQKTLQSVRNSSLPDLVTRLVSILQPSNDSMLMLTLLTSAARPLTYDELGAFYGVDPVKGTKVDRRLDISILVQEAEPFVSRHNDVIRIRHPRVQTTLVSLFDQGKLPVPVKNRPMDILSRTLAYAKLVLTDKGEPTLDNTDLALPSRLFSRHPLLEYAVRYWPFHLRNSPIAPPGVQEPKDSKQLQAVLPDSTTMPILEWICWDDQFPGAAELDLHILVGRIRKTVLSENHPAVMQSYINIATYYEPMGNDREASKYYYHATVIGQKILGAYHPITVECGNRFLGLTEPMSTTSRTEIMTQRERVLIILITAYERQFGQSSDMVLRTRQLLAELYMHIHEEDHATEIMRIVHGTTANDHSKNNDRGLELSEHLRVHLGKAKRNGQIDAYGDGIFTDREIEEDELRELDLDRVAILLREAETFASQSKSLEAEQTYVELWQQLSERCRTTLSSEWHTRKVDTVNAYSRFLQTQKREVETASILTALAQEYQHHELSYTESIVSRLVQSAHTLKSVGHSSAALSIFRQAASYYQSTKKEQSREFSQIEEEIAITSSQVLEHATSASTLTEHSNQVSETSLQSVFYSMIRHKSRAVDKQTMTLAMQLTSQYMQARHWSQAISVIEATVQRTWTSFFATSLQSVTMANTFVQESVKLVQQLAECYAQQRLLEKTEDVYVRCFRATLTSPKQHKDLLDLSTELLITFYDRHGYPDRAITVYQELLAAYRRVYGPAHDLTVRALYQLGSRCRAHARTHPYWIEYYQQISSAVNKDSDICHQSAMEAAILVAYSYWEERRYTEAVTTFTLLWNTLITKTKDYKQFSDSSFVQKLYERYYQSLESTQAGWATLQAVTKQYYNTAKSTFGANSTITVSAMLTLAHVTQLNEERTDEAIQYYEEASKVQSSYSSSKEQTSENRNMRQQLATLYKRRITTSSSVSSEQIAKAASVYQEQLAESRNAYGYAHVSTLNSLHEFAMLQCRQQKSDVAVRELSTAVAEINTKTTSSEKMIESAKRIASTFIACGQTQQCTELISELHRQLIAKERRKSSRFDFDLTSSSSASLVFLASLEYNLRSNASITFSEILSDIIAEHIYYQQFQKVMKARSGLDKIVIAAAPLRYFLIKRGRKDQAQSLEDQIVQLFIQRDTAGMKLQSQDSPRIFIISVLDKIGHRKTTPENFVRAVILASNSTLSNLIAQNKFAEAYDVANIAFIYAQHHKGYHGARAISRGFELASYLDGRGENRCPEEGLRRKLLELSNKIIKEVLHICRDQKIVMAQVQLPELNQLIALLGEQGDYETLESLLTELWGTREAQRNWPSQVLLNLGQRLVCARYLADHSIKALRLCEDIAYNLRRVHGARHPATLETYGLLAQLYTSVGQQYQKNAEKDKSAAGIASEYFKKAVLVHEDVLRWLVGGISESSDDDEDTAAMILKDHGVSIDEDGDGRADEDDVDKPALVKQHLHLLKLAYQRLGSWPKQYAVYEKMNADVFRVYGEQLKGVEGVEKWTAKGFGAGKAERNDGVFAGVSDWAILPGQMRQDLEAEEAL